jgi:hypothetical protein
MHLQPLIHYLTTITMVEVERTAVTRQMTHTGGRHSPVVAVRGKAHLGQTDLEKQAI